MTDDFRLMTILHIETSTNVCSAALSKNGVCLVEKVNFDGLSHATLLSPYIQEILNYAKNNNLTLDAVAVSCGPGSYTGLRIGVSTAKGLCFGFGVPLIAVNTLAILAVESQQSKANSSLTTYDFRPSAILLCPMIDARRMEVYTALYDSDLREIRATSAEIITETSFADLLDTQQIVFFGNGAAKCRSTITHKNALFIENIYPTAKNMISLAEAQFAKKEFVDTAYFEPFYLKDFIATVPKNKVFTIKN